MIKLILIFGLVALSLQHQQCVDLTLEECEASVSCRYSYNGNVNVCFDAIYRNLGHRRTLEQQVIFDIDANCDYLVAGRDFYAKKTFHNKKFQSFCGFNNVEGVSVNGQFYGAPQTFVRSFTSAIIHPSAPTGTAYLYSRKYFRGDSWVAAGPTKLNGQTIRSIQIGPDTQISLYDKEGFAIEGYQQLWYYDATEENKFLDANNNLVGIVDFKHYKNLEYVLVEYSYT